MERRYLAMVAMDCPPIVTPPSYEYCLECNYLLQQPGLNDVSVNSSTIGIGKHFYSRVKNDATQPWTEDRIHVIYLDEDKLTIEILDRANQLSELAKDDVAKKAVTFVDRLGPIKEILGLSVTQLSDLFGVTRKTVYDWFDGIEPRQNNEMRLEILAQALDSYSDDADLKRLKVVWNIPVSGRSFREIYNDDNALADGTLLDKLAAKLYELSPKLVKKIPSVHKKTAVLSKSHLIELDKDADFS